MATTQRQIRDGRLSIAARNDNGAAAHARVDILGVRVSAISMAQALASIDHWIEAREQNYVCVTDVHCVMEIQRDASLRTIYERAGMVTPDGMPLVWLSRRRGHDHVERVYGPDLMLECCARSAELGYRHFFYGAGEGVAALLAERLKRRFPGLIVAGTYSPPFRKLSAEEDEQVVALINETRPDIVWVGLGAPKQERWMAEHAGRLHAPVMIGVGAAFDFHAGTKRQSPRWMQRSGLEWFFRLATEPRRLWWRYLRNHPVFLWRLMNEKATSPAIVLNREPVVSQATNTISNGASRVMSIVSNDSEVVATPDQVSCDLAGETVILSVKDSTYYGLDPVGSFVWNLLQERRRVSDIRGEMLRNFDVEPERCERDLLALLEKMADHGLIEVRAAVAA
jgi:N-acetylglucosaminyldiphosphoundecaprenol N-acetyl-beta-D-mannosaminyltransferase